MWYFWLIAAGIFFIFEAATHGFLMFWLGIAALITVGASFFTDSILVQTSIFLISSCVLIPFTKPMVNKFVHNFPTKPMNSLSLVGRQAIVIVEINTTLGTGQVKVNGETWSARCQEGTTIPKDTEVEVVAVEGAKLLVAAKSSINK